MRNGVGAGEEQHEQERHDLVDDDAAVVGRAERAPGDLRRPCAEHEQQRRSPRANPASLAYARSSERDRNRDERAERARRQRRKPGAEAERDEMRRMAEQEAAASVPCGVLMRAKVIERRAAAPASGAPCSSRHASPAPRVIAPMRVSGDASLARDRLRPVRALAGGAVKHSS